MDLARTDRVDNESFLRSSFDLSLFVSFDIVTELPVIPYYFLGTFSHALFNRRLLLV